MHVIHACGSFPLSPCPATAQICEWQGMSGASSGGMRRVCVWRQHMPTAAMYVTPIFSISAASVTAHRYMPHRKHVANFLTNGAEASGVSSSERSTLGRMEKRSLTSNTGLGFSVFSCSHCCYSLMKLVVKFFVCCCLTFRWENRSQQVQ